MKFQTTSLKREDLYGRNDIQVSLFWLLDRGIVQCLHNSSVAWIKFCFGFGFNINLKAKSSVNLTDAVF